MKPIWIKTTLTKKQVEGKQVRYTLCSPEDNFVRLPAMRVCYGWLRYLDRKDGYVAILIMPNNAYEETDFIYSLSEKEANSLKFDEFIDGFALHLSNDE